MTGHPAFAALGRTVETFVDVSRTVWFPTTVIRVDVNDRGVVTFVLESGTMAKIYRAPHEVKFPRG